MTPTCTLLTIGLLAFSTTAIGKDVACAPRAEIGETTSGEHIYERDADLKLKNLSRIDFDNLTILSAEGRKAALIRVENNVFRSASSGTPYYFITNEARSVVTEISVRSNAAYVKVLLCK